MGYWQLNKKEVKEEFIKEITSKYSKYSIRSGQHE